MENNSTFELFHQSVVDNAMTDDERLLEKLRITRDKELPPMRFLFRIFGKPCFPRGELVAVTGKAKSGKTLFNSMLMACCFNEEVLQIQRPFEDVDGTWQCPPLRCMWYDTEQSEQSTQDILNNRILRLVTMNRAGPSGQAVVEENFDVFNVRSLHYNDRLRLFESAVRRYRPSLVILDGVRDLLSDINDAIKAQEIVEHLMKLVQETDCCLVCVLHQNKGAEDRNLRGWIGTELMNKAFEVYSCEKVKPENIFVVEQTHTRKYSLDEMLFFRMDEETELPVVCDAPTRYATSGVSPTPSHQVENRAYMNREYLTFDEYNRPHPKTYDLFYEALKNGPLYYTDLQTKVTTLLNCGTPMWNNLFCSMRDNGGIVRIKNRDGKAVWQLRGRETAVPSQRDMFDQRDVSQATAPPLRPPI